MLLFLVSPSAGQDSGDVTFKSAVANVRVDAQVIQDGMLITNLTAQDFVVRENDKPQPIVYFGHEKEPLSLLLLFDVSGSMRKYVEQVASVARQSMRYLRPKDRVAVMVFARDTHVRTDFSDDMSAIANEIREAAGDESVGTATNLNDALLAAADYMEEKSGETGRKAVLVLTDNMGLNYKSPDQPVIDAMHEASTVLNAIVVGKGRRPNPEFADREKNPDFTTPDVFTISEQTGGEAVKADAAGAAFERMIERIRTRYSIHYNMPDSSRSGYRRIDVELTPAAKLRYPRAEVRARKGYRVGAPARVRRSSR
ncbi:MAG TPA: VWA domain-containing protein [Bryobacteraceae bacterium]|nr:VWA domain-containing protein [Bryobacteraceae bacterium]